MSRNEPDGQFVYVYLDPESGVVRYVGSGRYDRMYHHTKASHIDGPFCESPFKRWLRKNRDTNWVEYRKRVFGPVSQEEAIAHEQMLIEKHFDTTLNTRAAGNGQEMKPTQRRKLGPNKPRIPMNS